MSTIMKASHEWATRPDDERYTSLTDMLAFQRTERAASKQAVVSSRELSCRPADQEAFGKLEIFGKADIGYEPTNWAFGQLASLGKAPASYLRTLPSPMAADCINYGMQTRPVEDTGVLVFANGKREFRAATGPNYGRVWNADVTEALVNQFGDGIHGGGRSEGHWKVPGEFGQAVTVTQANTTLYSSDRDMFVFLADERNRIEVPGRRNGSGSMARGFLVWNSEVGKSTLGLALFLFDFVCCNRIIWGAEGYQEIRIKHTSGAPDRFIEEMKPALISYANSGTGNVLDAIASAKEKVLAEKVDEFIANRFGKGLVSGIKTAHLLEEQRPIETVWDVVTGSTAYAKGITHQDARVAIEREAGKLLKLAA